MVSQSTLFLSHSHTHTQALKDWVLFVQVLVIVSIDLIIIVIGSAIPQSRLLATKIRDTQHPEATMVNKILFVLKMFIFMSVM